MPASRLILRLGQLRILFMREIQEQATPPSLDRLVKHLFGFQRAERTPGELGAFTGQIIHILAQPGTSQPTKFL
jgi:hypothetical protein